MYYFFSFFLLMKVKEKYFSNLSKVKREGENHFLKYMTREKERERRIEKASKRKSDE